MAPRAWDAARRAAGKFAAAALELASNPRFIAYAVVALSVALALLLRLAPMRWGIYLNEFDPFYEYYLAEKLLEKGNGNLLQGLAWWYSWWFNRGERDTLFWAPYGRDLRASSQIGAPLFSAATYTLLKALGFEVDLYTVHAFIPAVGAATASLFAYLLGKEIWDESVGTLASVFMACSWPFIYRTNLGAKHEGVAIPFMLLSLTLLVQAVRRNSAARALLSGVAMVPVVLAWGGFIYPWNLVSLAVLAWLIFNPEAANVAKAFLLFIVPVDAAIATMPRFGPAFAFASLASVVPWSAIAASVLVLAHAMPSRRVALRVERKWVAVAVALTAAALVAGWYSGLLLSLPGRILAVLVPVWREVGVTTVAEHAVPTWASIYQDYGPLLPLSAFGALLCGYRYRKRFEDTLMALLWLSSAYAAASMARLTLAMAPAVALLAAHGMSEVFGALLAPRASAARGRRGEALAPEILAIPLIVVAILPLLAIARQSSVAATHQPALILSSSVPVLDYDYQYTDWLSALEWIKANVPERSVIATWWDYGYWISVNTRRNSTCDNATIDTKQIQRIARAFLSSEEEALRIFKELNVSYVVVYEPFLKAQLPYLGIYVYYSPAYGGLGGDLAKSYQMARWIGENPDKYLAVGYVDGFPVLVPADTPEARNATLYRLLFAKIPGRSFFIFEKLPFGTTIQNYQGPSPDIPQPRHFKLVFASKPNAWVLVYKVEYPSGG